MGGAHHHHVTGAAANVRGLALTLGLVLLYMAAEVVGGILSNSLALLADAGHMLSDAAALGLSLFAIWLARRPSGPQSTFGYYRTEILAALANGTALVVIAVFVVWEAVERFRDPPEVQGGLMMAIAAGGLLVNLTGLWLLHKGRTESLNIRGAWLHVLTDTLGSIQAIVAGALILGFGWIWADPLASCLIAALVVYSAWKLLKETLAVIMEQAPGHIDVDEVRDAVLGLEGVMALHDLHLWTITSGLECLSAHVVSSEYPAPPELLARIRQELSERFGIDHTTIQIEPEDFDESLVCD